MLCQAHQSDKADGRSENPGGVGASSNEVGIICPSWLEGVNWFAKIWRGGGGGQMLPLSPDSVGPSDIGVTACGPVTFFYNIVF